MLTGVCPKCRGRFVLVLASTGCRCPVKHAPDPCPGAKTARVLRKHEPCGRHVRPREGMTVAL